jgi:hypothetical protein
MKERLRGSIGYFTSNTTLSSKICSKTSLSESLLLLDTFQQTYGDAIVIALLGFIFDFNSDDLEEAPSIQTHKNILEDRHYTCSHLKQLINNALLAGSEIIRETLRKLMRRDKFQENRFVVLSRKLTEYFVNERKNC